MNIRTIATDVIYGRVNRVSIPAEPWHMPSAPPPAAVQPRDEPVRYMSTARAVPRTKPSLSVMPPEADLATAMQALARAEGHMAGVPVKMGDNTGGTARRDARGEILMAFIAAHPKCTVREIMGATALSVHQVNGALSILTAAGKVTVGSIYRGGSRSRIYSAVTP